MNEDFVKYLGIANHDIQTANNIGELKSYVASILYDNDKKVELLQQKENIIKEKDKEIERLNNIINELEEYMIDKDIYKILLYKLRDLKEVKKSE